MGGKPTIHGASFPAEIWADYMGKALKGGARPAVRRAAADRREGVRGRGQPLPPSAAPSAPPSAQPSASASPSASKSPSASPSPSKQCKPGKCRPGQIGGVDGGDTGGPGGVDGGTGDTPTPDPSRRQTGGGGLFGGPQG
ncbi:hypothetical protein GCM10020000_40180 [Streptomyces olivoverticillatus]